MEGKPSDLWIDALFFTDIMKSFADVEHKLSFVATKCDDISCNEIIRALSLKDDPILEEIEDNLDDCQSDTQIYKKKKTVAKGVLTRMFLLDYIDKLSHGYGQDLKKKSLTSVRS